MQIRRLLRSKTWNDLNRPVRNRKGVAIIMAIAAILLITTFATELVYESNVEYIVNSQNLNRLKSYYAAKSGVKLSLLRIKLYQTAQSQFGQQLGDSPMLDEIWRFPFAWPLPAPDELNAVDKDAFAKATKESSMDASYMVTIEDEGSKIDINDLASPSKALREATAQQLLNVFEQKKLDDEEFNREYANFRFNELVISIRDWMSDINSSEKGGDKRSSYSEMNSLAGGQDYYPPNRGFRTLAELHMVPGMTDVFYRILEPRITIYGMKGINPNLASREVLKSLDPGMTDEVVDEIIKRRGDQNLGGPFKCDQNGGSEDFWGFAQQRGARLMGNTQSIPLTCEKAINFKIRSTGQFATAAREITAVVLDLNKVAEKVDSFVKAEKQGENAEDEANQTGPGGRRNQQQQNQQNQGNQRQNQQQGLTKGPPRIVFWSEK